MTRKAFQLDSDRLMSLGVSVLKVPVQALLTLTSEGLLCAAHSFSALLKQSAATLCLPWHAWMHPILASTCTCRIPSPILKEGLGHEVW